MSTMADLVRRTCACGTIWYQRLGEPKATECNECFRKKRTRTMTTVQVRDELDQTTPEEIPEVAAQEPETNGQAIEEPPPPRRVRTRRAVASSPEQNGKAHAPDDDDEGPVDVLDRAEAIVREINAEEARLLARLDRIRANKRALGYADASLEDTTQSLPPRRARSAREPLAPIAHRAPARPRKAAGKRHRRSAEEIAELVTAVVALVKKHKEGLRAEQIREQVGLEAKEMPMVLKTAVSGRLLKTKGQKRATTYFAV